MSDISTDMTVTRMSQGGGDPVLPSCGGGPGWLARGHSCSYHQASQAVGQPHRQGGGRADQAPVPEDGDTPDAW